MQMRIFERTVRPCFVRSSARPSFYPNLQSISEPSLGSRLVYSAECVAEFKLGKRVQHLWMEVRSGQKSLDPWAPNSKHSLSYISVHLFFH